MADLLPHIQDVTLGVGQVVCESGETPAHVYFPNTAVISVVSLLRDGRLFEVQSIGNEGAANLFPALTGIPSNTRSFVQMAGRAFRLPTKVLQSRLEQPLLHHILAYLQISAGQGERTIACNAVHSLSERLARWLLITEDRVHAPVMMLTQDYMCVMTGALRSSVSVTASAFKRDRLITYSRGRLEILDRPGLARRACECYRSDQEDLGHINNIAWATGAPTQSL